MKPHTIPDNSRNAATNYQKGKEYFRQRWQTGQVPTCSPGYISGQCTGGHKFAAPFLCGRETCPDCGRDGSPIHQRRVSRWLPLVQQYKRLGYLVLTFPQQLRWILSDRETLSDFRYQFRRKLKRMATPPDYSGGIGTATAHIATPKAANYATTPEVVIPGTHT